MISWKNLDTLESYQELANAGLVNLAEVMTGENGAERVKKYSAPMAEGLVYNYGAKKVDDNVLAEEIYEQNAEVSRTLGVDYQMHFLRPMGGDNRYDQRTHNYMRQMGYSGIAYWAQVGSNNTASQIMKDLQPGQIILFHTTAEDLRIVKSLVPKLVAKGYKMVTMNELFGLEPNAQTELTENAAPIPLEPFTRFEQTLKRGDWLHDVKLMQDKLTELGYLNDKCDGKFGEVTKAALKEFQAEHGLDPTGVCDSATWALLFPQ